MLNPDDVQGTGIAGAIRPCQIVDLDFDTKTFKWKVNEDSPDLERLMEIDMAHCTTCAYFALLQKQEEKLP